jgi:agmatinase
MIGITGDLRYRAGHGSTYPGKDSSGHALAADAIRAASQDDAALIEHWDFDLGGPLFDGKPVCCIDAGDIPTTMHDNAGNRARIEAKTREILACRLCRSCSAATVP